VTWAGVVLAALLAQTLWLRKQSRDNQVRTNRKLDRLMGDVQDAVDAVVAQLDKAKGEILNEITNLEAQIAAGETPDLSALKAAAQALDDVVPDAEPPVA
jgi:16S rRNA G1207 methylase RsmC